MKFDNLIINTVFSVLNLILQCDLTGAVFDIKERISGKLKKGLATWEVFLVFFYPNKPLFSMYFF